MKTSALISTFALAFVSSVLCATAPANAQTPPAASEPEWDFDRLNTPSLGMNSCGVRVNLANPGSSVNLQRSDAPGRLTVHVEAGTPVTISVSCAPGGSFSSTFGGGTAFGTPKPPKAGVTGKSGDFSASPPGVAWTVTAPVVAGQAASGSISYSLGSNTMNVEVIAIEGPAARKYVIDTVAPVRRDVDRVINNDFRLRAMEFQFAGTRSLDTAESGHDPRWGFSGQINYLWAPGSSTNDSEFKLSIGLTHQMQFWNSHVRLPAELNQQPVGETTSRKTFFTAPRFGLDWMPMEHFFLKGGVSLGWLAIQADAAELSQLKNLKVLHDGPEWQNAFGGSLDAGLGLQFGAFRAGLGFSATRNFTGVYQTRPIDVCANGKCSHADKAWFTDVNGQLTLGGAW